MKKTNFIKHIESLYELGVIKKDEEMRYKKLYHKSSESLKETMDENPQFIVKRFNEDLNKRIQNRILNNVLFFFWITIIGMILSVVGYFLLN